MSHTNDVLVVTVRGENEDLCFGSVLQDLSRRFDLVNDALKSFPAILGHPGTPGYRVAATARLQLNSLFVRGMDRPLVLGMAQSTYPALEATPRPFEGVNATNIVA